jgi:hypothetical protein
LYGSRRIPRGEKEDGDRSNNIDRHQAFLPMKRRIFSLALALSATLSLGHTLAGDAHADSWIFGQPFHANNQPATQPPPSRRPEGGPFYTRPHGAFFSSGLRNSRTTINVRGRMVDNLILWESWYQTGAQF